MITQQIKHSDLLPGDIFMLYNNEHQYFMHVGVVSSKKCGDVNYWLHAVFKPSEHLHFTEPYTAERLAEYNWSVYAFRIADQTIRERMLQIMETWANYAVKFDHKRLNTAVARSRDVLGVEWDYSKKILPAMGCVTDETFANAVTVMKSEFDINHVIKYAVRRETSPVKPAANPADEHGFRCLMYLLTALQSAYVMDEVPAINDHWTSLHHTVFVNPVTESLRRQQLTEVEFKANLTHKIPEELRLPAGTCVPEVFYRSILNSTHLIPLGKYDPVHRADLPAEMQVVDKDIQMVDEGVRKKAEMYQQMIEGPSTDPRLG